jgi:hypothetical protein
MEWGEHSLLFSLSFPFSFLVDNGLPAYNGLRRPKLYNYFCGIAALAVGVGLMRFYENTAASCLRSWRCLALMAGKEKGEFKNEKVVNSVMLASTCVSLTM